MERKLAGISVEAASAIAGVLVCELGRDVWGQAEHPDEAQEQLQGWERQLQELQAVINDTVITWADLEGGGPTAFGTGRTVELMPAENLAARAADAGTLMPVLLRAA